MAQAARPCDSSPMLLPWMLPADLAPGDAKSLSRDWSALDFHVIKSVEDPAFAMAFGALWAQFGALGEMEQPEVIARRLQWDPTRWENGCALLYEMMLLTTEGRFAAVRDHTAIVIEDGVVIHLSHNLIAPEWRRTGLAGWLRALPVQTARAALAAQELPIDSPITIVAEMEHLIPGAPNPRLIAYEKAGYLKIDPRRIPYAQPDFRPPEVIDATGGTRPLPLQLNILQVGRETETTISGKKARSIALAFYKMYAASLRASDVAPLIAALSAWPADDELIDLFPPTMELPA